MISSLDKDSEGASPSRIIHSLAPTTKIARQSSGTFHVPKTYFRTHIIALHKTQLVTLEESTRQPFPNYVPIVCKPASPTRLFVTHRRTYAQVSAHGQILPNPSNNSPFLDPTSPSFTRMTSSHLTIYKTRGSSENLRRF